MRWVVGYIAALCLVLIIVSQSIIFPTFFEPFFVWQYNRLNVAETIDIEKDELMRVTTDLLDYMRNRRDSLEDVYGVVAGVERRFFSDIEIRHMIDVLELYNIAFMVRNVAFFALVGLILALLLLRSRVLYVLTRCFRDVLVGFLTGVSLLVIAIAINFERAFDLFHHMFFNNDYWILDPRVDLLINMVPLGFFIHISIFIALLIVISCGIIIAGSIIYLKRMPRMAFGKL